MIENSGPIVLYDGVCGLCDRFVQFVIRRDPTGCVRFAPLQSDKGKEFLHKFALQEKELSFIVLVEGESCHIKSAAVLRTLAYLNGPLRAFTALRFIPSSISDTVYDVVASHRYTWFGKYEECKIPTAEERKRFLS